MANHHLGPRIDVHGGGADLIFPHHSSEIAQSESASGEHPFVRHWVHVGLVWMDGEKMSKSLGNLAFVRDLAPRYGADALRAYLLAFPYRERLDYVENELARAATRWDPVRRAAQGPAEGTPSSAAEELASVCLAALDDDLDTPRALDTLRRLAELVLRTESSGDRGSLASLLGVLGFGVTARTTSS
jgi:L-cysteine:1D-myo-inositol 2-amino-2-deoxy-alpha-D-glucopyranoside ligase